MSTLLSEVLKLSPAEQFDLAFKTAENVGYILAKGSSVAWRWRWKDKLENNPWRLVMDASGISHITAEIQPLYRIAV